MGHRLAIGLLTIANLAFAHDPTESRIALEGEWNGAQTAGKISLQFQLLDTKSKDKDLITPEKLNVVHEKKIHMFIFDPALEVFEHVHPEFKNDLWQVDVELKTNGKYWVWVQGELSADEEEFTSSSRLVVKGGEKENPSPPILKENRTGKDGNSVATLSNE